MIKYCNCTIAFLFPPQDYPVCNITGLLCLIKYNEIFNAEKPLIKSPFFNEDEDGISCFCNPECSRIEYSTVINPIYDEEPIDDELVLIDIFYANPVMMKYRTDVTFSFMDLVVGFGGIMGLFFGASILSGMEMIFYSSIALFYQYRRNRGEIVEIVKTKFPFLN
jgi:amiloride-sensitive sodium channel